MCVSHPVSWNFKIHFSDILCVKVANSASQKSPAGPANEKTVISRSDCVFMLASINWSWEEATEERYWGFVSPTERRNGDTATATFSGL